MPLDPLALTIAIPTLGREQVLLDTISMLLAQEPAAREILVLDQSHRHEAATEKQLLAWHHEQCIEWIHLTRPSQPGALNEALRRATEKFVLFLDDDIRIESGFLAAHIEGFSSNDVWVVAGQVLQPGETPDNDYVYVRNENGLADTEFRFCSNRPAHIQNGMSGNMTVRRERALELGGFDENFTPPVAYRFDADFCKRVCKAGGTIFFQPKAPIHHLRAPRGGTRTNSNHLTSMSPEHGVGDYYYALQHSQGTERWTYVFRRMTKEVCTRFHLRHPWWIPIKMAGEIRALVGALSLHKTGPRLINLGSNE